MEGQVRLGLAHEEQHQELLLMDLLHLFSQSPQRTAYDPEWRTDLPGRSGRFRHVSGGLVDVGAVTSGFSFDNEGPRHRVWLQSFEISDRLVTCREWLAFMEDGGYRRAELWLSDGWAMAPLSRGEGPLFLVRADCGWEGSTPGRLRNLVME